MEPICAISPIDGRYRADTEPLAAFFSEYALIRYRVLVEVRWLVFLADRPEIGAVRQLADGERTLLEEIVATFDPGEAERVKAIESVTRHDVKAVEYYLRERLAATSLADVAEFVHFFCTSEDISNLAYAQMLRDGLQDAWLPLASELVGRVANQAQSARSIPMLSRTHGQPASPTTLGKELAVFAYRWRRQLSQLDRAQYLGKMNGAVGAYNTHAIAYPDADWETLSRLFVESLGLTWNPLTTQIEPHDYVAEIAHNLIRFHNIGIDFDRDVWTYISLGYFRQKVVAGEIGSSTMPHKVNPINFENSEANFGVSSALLDHLASKLAVSRLQRDLSDTSALRNLGPAIAHSHLALRYALRGLDTLEIDKAAISSDLDDAWEVLAEPVQTMMKKAGMTQAYEKLKELTRGRAISRDEMRAFIASLDLPDGDKRRLLELTPASYVGLAANVARRARSG